MCSDGSRAYSRGAVRSGSTSVTRTATSACSASHGASRSSFRIDTDSSSGKGGPDNSLDKLRNVHEHLFHFVRSNRYYYDADAIRSRPRRATVTRGAVVSATGVSGVRYRRQLELSTSLTASERRAGMAALDAMLEEVRAGRLSDFRMIIRGQQRTTHSDSEAVSGRAKEIRQRGFYFLKYHPRGAKPSDVWDIIPEDTQRRQPHYAPFPEDLCRIPILATCPEAGVVLDPFAGTGTTNVVAYELGRRSIGIDVSREYLRLAERRCANRVAQMCATARGRDTNSR
jgi:site-specific DNA-methyltransferase (adenine-specific)